MKKILFLLFFSSIICSHDDKKIIDHLLESSTKHVFNVDQESFLLKMIYDNNQLVYRAVYPFNNIETPGTYRISTMVNNNLAINTSNVTLDLNGNTISGQVTIAANLENITIKNGVIDTTTANGLLINSGCSSITLSDLTVRNATRGINANGLIDSVIIGCDLSRNTTGLELDTCHNITVQECNAISNLNAGFCLLTSTTCTFIECQALSTGENNNETFDQTIIGFVSANGNGNTFKQCTANSTQGLSVTDSDSLIAGFALRGSESGSSVCECTAANATSSASGVTIPYGILLEATIGSEFTLTHVVGLEVTQRGRISWNQDGSYIAVSQGASTGNFELYTFDWQDVTTQSLTLPSDVSFGAVSRANDWHPSGNIVAVGLDSGDTYGVRVFRIDRFDNNSVAQIATPNVTPTSNVYSVSWNPNGNYLAIGQESGSRVLVYQYDQVGMSLTSFATPASNNPAAVVNGVAWSPDGNYLAVASNDSPYFRIFELDVANAQLTFVTSFTFGGDIRFISWSFDGRYIALGTEGYNDDPIEILEFTGSSLTAAGSANLFSGGSVTGIQWSADGNYIAVTNANSPYARIVSYDRSQETVAAQAVSNVTLTADANGIAWSPDGRYLAIGLNSADGGLSIYETLSFPSNNVINNNQVYCNSGGSIPSGIGISGSSISNLMIGNSAFDNPISPFMVYSNYAFVTNVYNQNFGTPNVLQNLSFGSTEPIQTPDDTILRLEQSISKACDIQSKVNILLSIYG